VISKRLLCLFLILSASCGFCYAGGRFREFAVDYYNEAVAAQKKGDFMQAMSRYQKALLVLGSEDSDYIKKIYNNVAVIYAQANDFQSAEAAFLSALDIDPKYKQANFNLGVLYAKQGNSEKALEYWAKATGRQEIFVIEEETKGSNSNK